MSSQSAFDVNPLVSRLVEHEGDLSVVRGYVGPSKSKEKVRLYPVLGKLTHFIEINAADIVETAPAPTNVLPHDGIIAWVHSDAEVVLHGDTIVTVPARTLRRRGGGVASVRADAAPAQAADYVDVERGRLRISVPAAAEIRSDCEVCASCGPCSSCSGVCQSGPA